MSEAEDRDLLAAEYVLGCLDAEQLRAVERLLVEDPAFATAIETWQNRLIPLGKVVGPAEPPPELWGRINASIAPPPSNAAPLRRVRFWQATTGAALALAASGKTKRNRGDAL